MEIVVDKFTSDVVEHCNYVPICIDLNGNTHLEIPSTMYIFAWGAGTMDAKISLKRGISSANTERYERANRRTRIRRRTVM